MAATAAAAAAADGTDRRKPRICNQLYRTCDAAGPSRRVATGFTGTLSCRFVIGVSHIGDAVAMTDRCAAPLRSSSADALDRGARMGRMGRASRVTAPMPHRRRGAAPLRMRR
ncbi:hypothetical protein C7S16_2481 [Burkholderia thailandensis]|uniref:Uncharacterized protein n=1 Tax=Burkholderia thailandensis TaxID=57975 RepID=A0AAW9D2L7_BURTH|nr:hypothetical protein [Burkholderia thailandensis]MDW9255559.1 hypothetical protein [Burkholderia thailandensis]